MGHGQCDDGSQGTGECVCEHGFFGVACHLKNQPGGETGTSNLECPNGNFVSQEVSFMVSWQMAGGTRNVKAHDSVPAV